MTPRRRPQTKFSYENFSVPKDFSYEKSFRPVLKKAIA